MGMILNVVKTGLGLGVSIGTGTIVNNIVKTVTPGNTNKAVKVCISMASMVIGGMVGNAVMEHFENDFDETVENVNEIIGKIKKRNQEEEEESEEVEGV